jgi:hypothetical protein
MRRTRLAFALTVAGALLAFAVGAARAAPTTIDFEAMTGPSFFDTVDPPVTIGVATFSGGEVMTAVSNLPANQTTVYGTASFCAGCAPSISITFSRPVSNVSMQVLNGEATMVSYTVGTDRGGNETKSLVPNFQSGAAMFSLPDSGVTSVTISRTIPADFWDFFVDNVSFTAFPTSKDECKNGGWQSFGVFKNQGDCVSYVATGGRNQPG